MNNDLIKDVTDYVTQHISEFHASRIKKLSSLSLKKLLKQKNPYLFRAKNLVTPGALVEELSSAFMSSAEETLFGDWLEGLAIYVNKAVYGGIKSSAEGIDLEFDKDGIHYLVSIKSGPKWSNSSSLSKMCDHFNKARRILHTSNNRVNVVAVNGCCYGRDSSPYKKDGYYKYCGEEFWTFISGEPMLYTDIIEPLGTNAKEKNEEYAEAYAQMVTRFTCEFAKDFCDIEKGTIDWAKIIQLNSGKK